MKADDRICAAVELITSYGGIDSAHHKQWVLDQVLRALLSEAEYCAWLKDYHGENIGDEDDPEYEYEWDRGVAP